MGTVRLVKHIAAIPGPRKNILSALLVTSVAVSCAVKSDEPTEPSPDEQTPSAASFATHRQAATVTADPPLVPALATDWFRQTYFFATAGGTRPSCCIIAMVSK